MAEDGKIPERYPVTELPSANYSERTARNVADSSGTLMLEVCREKRKPYLVIDTEMVSANDAVRLMEGFVSHNRVGVLNVAGPRASQWPTGRETIAKDAYIYGFPLVDSYRIQYALLRRHEESRVRRCLKRGAQYRPCFYAEGKAVQTPNSDTPYTLVGMDLRTEPIVLTVPAIEKERYYSILIDAYTHNFDYIGSRATGNEAGGYLIAGSEVERRSPKGCEESHPVRDRAPACRLSHPALQSGRPREREENTVGLQSAAALRVSRPVGS